ncbi:MAG: rhs element Vgr protein [Spirochaetales bacterium]|nr:rhs element Vgr protein [Spirochaetales bacterium]
MGTFYQNGPLYGIITDNADPDGLGRVKVKLAVLGEDIETNWIPVMTLYGSAECGAFFIPEVDDQVVVVFLNDNPEQGIVLGSVWSEAAVPPETGENTGSDLNQDGENNLKFIKSRSGHQIILDDKDGEEKIQILAADGKTRFEFLAKDEMINIETDKDLRISAGGKLSIEAEEGEITFDKGLKVEADKISMESKSKDIEAIASQNMQIEGSSVKLN